MIMKLTLYDRVFDLNFYQSHDVKCKILLFAILTNVLPSSLALWFGSSDSEFHSATQYTR